MRSRTAHRRARPGRLAAWLAAVAIAAPALPAAAGAADSVYWANLATPMGISYAHLDGSGGGDLATAGAAPSVPVFPALLKAPVGAGAPAVVGQATVGASLSCTSGSWAPDLLGAFLYRAPRSFFYQWLKDGGEIGGATSASVTPSQPGPTPAASPPPTRRALRRRPARRWRPRQRPRPRPGGKKKPSRTFGKAIGLGNSVVKGRRALLRLRCPGANPCKGVAS